MSGPDSAMRRRLTSLAYWASGGIAAAEMDPRERKAPFSDLFAPVSEPGVEIDSAPPAEL